MRRRGVYERGATEQNSHESHTTRYTKQCNANQRRYHYVLWSPRKAAARSVTFLQSDGRFLSYPARVLTRVRARVGRTRPRARDSVEMSENGNGSPLRGLSPRGGGRTRRVKQSWLRSDKIFQLLPIKDLCAMPPVHPQGRRQLRFRGFTGRFGHGFGIPEKAQQRGCVGLLGHRCQDSGGNRKSS